VAYLFLVLAIASEVTATVSLKLADGFTKPVPSALVVIGYVAAFAALSQALTRGLGIGLAYGVWAAAGVILVAVAGTFFGESLTPIQIGGIVLVVGGVLALELGAAR
jgi:small multidrug resistance pump